MGERRLLLGRNGLKGETMAKEDTLEFPGVVKELLPNATFRVELETAMRSSHIRQEKCARTVFGFWQVIRYKLK